VSDNKKSRAFERALELTACLTFAFAAAPALAAALEWKPDKHVELVVPTGPGSGVDSTFRTVQAILQTRKLVDAPMTVVNKPGGSYAIALAYLAQSAGDAHKLMIQTSTPLTAYIGGQIKMNYFELTPIANLISEPICFIVRADSPIRTGRDLLERLKADPSGVSIALAAARGNAYHIASALIARSAGVDARKLKIVVYNASGEGVAAALGGHVDVMSATPANVLPLLQAGKIRIIGVASKARLGGVAANIPTFREQGIDVVFDVPRGVIGPKGLTPQQVRYWESVFQALVKTDEWRQALDKNQWVEDFQTSAQMGKELKAQYEILKDVLSELGMVGAKP
jgi:putative tricarboxylic transport membrane protein